MSVYEFAAIAVGALLGVIIGRLGPRRPLLLGGIGSLLGGLLVSTLSGELAESWLFLVFDTAQCLVAALCVGRLVRVVSARRMV
jgi:hypothetical protein